MRICFLRFVIKFWIHTWFSRFASFAYAPAARGGWILPFFSSSDPLEFLRFFCRFDVRFFDSSGFFGELPAGQSRAKARGAGTHPPACRPRCRLFPISARHRLPVFNPLAECTGKLNNGLMTALCRQKIG